MNKNLKVLIIIGLNSYNFSKELSVDINPINPQKDYKNSNTIKNYDPLNLEDRRTFMIIGIFFINILFISILISSIGFLFEKYEETKSITDTKSKQDDEDEEDSNLLEQLIYGYPLKISTIIGCLFFILGIIIMFTKIIPYLFNKSNISFKRNILSNIIYIILSGIFLFIFIYFFIFTQNQLLSWVYNTFHIAIPITSFIIIIILIILGMYQNQQNIKKKINNPIMDILYKKIFDIVLIFFSLFILNVIYCLALIYSSDNATIKTLWPFIMGIFSLTIILTIFKIRKINFTDNIIPLLIFIISYILIQLFCDVNPKFSFHSNIQSSRPEINNCIAPILSLEILFVALSLQTFIQTHKENKLLIYNS